MRATALALYPEDSREAAELLKQAVPLMVRHNIAPNPVHYALWYTYSKGLEPELNRHLDRVVKDFESFPPEAASKLFRDYIIRDELADARIGQQQAINLMDTMERDVTRSVKGSLNFQASLDHCLDMLETPDEHRLPSLLGELQQSTQLMQDQQTLFLSQLHAAQNEIKNLRDKLEQVRRAATLDDLTRVLNRNTFNRHWVTGYSSTSVRYCAARYRPKPLPRDTAAKNSAWCCKTAATWPAPSNSPNCCA